MIGLLLMPVLYYAGALFANQFTVFTRGAVILWPPNSVLLAALMIMGRRDYLPLILGAVGAEILADIPYITWQEGLAFGLANAAEAGVALVVLRLWRFDCRFSTLNDLVKFIGAVAVLASFFGAVIGSWLHCYFGSTDTTYLEHARLLWFGDALGLMMFTPLWLSLWLPENRRETRSHGIITSPQDFAAGISALATLWLFIASRDGQFWGVHIGPNLLLPYVVYAGARFGVRWSSVGSAIVTLITIIMMDKGFNPLGDLPTREAVIQVQEFIFIMTLVSLGAAALFSKLRVQQSELETAKFSLKHLNRTLEDRVGERTTALVEANARLEKEMRERQQVEAALQTANRELHRLAEVDSLTQIANRRAFDICLQNEWRRSSREGAVLSLILFDIDFFKNYNDHYGHPAGDQCLRHIAAAAVEAVKRPSDLVARYGGEEFAVILPDTDRTGALTVIELIYSAIRARAIEHCRSDISAIVTISAGIATQTPSHQETPERLLQLADKALYRAKALGRDRFITEPEIQIEDGPVSTSVTESSSIEPAPFQLQ